MKQFYFFILYFSMCLTFANLAQSQVIYVKVDATGTNNGTSWENAYTSLRAAILASSASSQIWVAKGTYHPTTTTNRDIRFDIPTTKNGVKIYGGFAGNETSLDQRNIADNPTILSGNIGNSAINTDNSAMLIRTEVGITRNTVIDGFILQEIYGKAWNNGSAIHNQGSPTIQNCTFTRNTGEHGASIMNYTDAFPYIKDCIFKDNIGLKDAGGIYNFLNFNDSFDPNTNDEIGFVIENCIFKNNISQGTATESGVFGGAAIFNDNASGIIRNCTFLQNETQGVESHGGAILNVTHKIYSFSGKNKYKFDIKVQNCTFNDNIAITSGGAIQNTTLDDTNFARLTITNSNFQNNTPDNLAVTGNVVIAPISIPANNIALKSPTVCYGSAGQVLLENTEIGVDYQLYDKNTNLPFGTAKSVDGGTITFSIDAITNSQEFYAIAKNSYEVAVTIPNTTTLQPYQMITPTLACSDADLNICKNEMVTFTATGGSTYSFKVNGVVVQTGTSNIFMTSTLENTQQVSVEVFNAEGCSVMAEPMTLQVQSITPKVTLLASRSQVCQGSEITFTAQTENTGTNPTFEWKIDGQVTYSGQNSTWTTTLNKTSVIEVTVTPTVLCATTNAVKATTLVQVQQFPAPKVNITQRTTGQIAEYQEVIFEADVTAPYIAQKYQWYINNNPVKNATEKEFKTTTLKNNDEVKALVVYKTPCTQEDSLESNSILLNVATTFESLDKPVFEGIKVFPNPSNGVFNITADTESFMDNIEVQIYNKDGQLVYTNQKYEHTNLFTVDITQLPAGIYQLYVISDKLRWVHKIIKQ